MWASCSPSTSSSARCGYSQTDLLGSQTVKMHEIRDIGLILTSKKKEGVPLDLHNRTAIRDEQGKGGGTDSLLKAPNWKIISS